MGGALKRRERNFANRLPGALEKLSLGQTSTSADQVITEWALIDLIHTQTRVIREAGRMVRGPSQKATRTAVCLSKQTPIETIAL